MSKVILFSGCAEHGKTLSANLLMEEMLKSNKKVLIINFADYLKFICRSYFGWDGNKDENGRHILQHVGTDLFRKRKPNFWVDVIINLLDVIKNDYDYFLIGDCRFPNEIECFKKSGMETIAVKVIRLNYENHLTAEQRSHPSENSLDNYCFDYIIESESGKENLQKEIFKFIERYNL